MSKTCERFGGYCVGCRVCVEEGRQGAVCEICGGVILPGELYYDIGDPVCKDCIEEFLRFAN